MATAVLTLPAAPEQARTARLVAGAAARRAGVDDELIDDVRLAVAEAVALAVTGTSDDSAGVGVAMTDDGRSFGITVTWGGAADVDVMAEELALAVMESLADEMLIDSAASGGRSITMVWSTTP